MKTVVRENGQERSAKDTEFLHQDSFGRHSGAAYSLPLATIFYSSSSILNSRSMLINFRQSRLRKMPENDQYRYRIRGLKNSKNMSKRPTQAFRELERWEGLVVV